MDPIHTAFLHSTISSRHFTDIYATLPQLRRGVTLCIITGSTDRAWVRSLSALRRRGARVDVRRQPVIRDRPAARAYSQSVHS